MLVINIDLLAGNCLMQTLQSLLITEAVICLTLINKLLGIFKIDSALLSVTLYIRTVALINVRAFIMLKSGFLKSPVYNINSSLNQSLLVRILYSKNKISAFMLGNKICIQCSTQITDMHTSCRTGRKPCPYLHSVFLLNHLFSTPD